MTRLDSSSSSAGGRRLRERRSGANELDPGRPDEAGAAEVERALPLCRPRAWGRHGPCPDTSRPPASRVGVTPSTSISTGVPCFPSRVNSSFRAHRRRRAPHRLDDVTVRLQPVVHVDSAGRRACARAAGPPGRRRAARSAASGSPKNVKPVGATTSRPSRDGPAASKSHPSYRGATIGPEPGSARAGQPRDLLDPLVPERRLPDTVPEGIAVVEVGDRSDPRRRRPSSAGRRRRTLPVGVGQLRRPRRGHEGRPGEGEPDDEREERAPHGAARSRPGRRATQRGWSRRPRRSSPTSRR